MSLGITTGEQAHAYYQAAQNALEAHLAEEKAMLAKIDAENAAAADPKLYTGRNDLQLLSIASRASKDNPVPDRLAMDIKNALGIIGLPTEYDLSLERAFLQNADDAQELAVGVAVFGAVSAASAAYPVLVLAAVISTTGDHEEAAEAAAEAVVAAIGSKIL